MNCRRNVSANLPHIVVLTLLLASDGASAQSLGSAFTYQGQLKEFGQPASGLYDLQACLFDTPSNPIPLACAPDFNDVPVEGGLFAITLDFGSAPFVGQQRFLELRVRPGASASGYTILAPRQLIRPAPEALRSNVSASAPWSGITGVPAGFADSVDNDSGGTVTSITTGAGLTGGPITNTGSVSVAAGGIGATQINPAQVQSRVTGNCAVGLFVRAVNQDGTVVCDAAGVGSITGVTAGMGLTGGGTSGTVSLGIAPGGVGETQINTAQVQSRVTGNCVIGEYVRAVNQDGTVACDDDTNSGGTVTSIGTGAGLAGGPITGSGTIAVAAGGIGAMQIDPSQVQLRVTGTCPLGEYLRGVNTNGSVICQSLPLVATTQFTLVDSNGGYFSSIAIGSDSFPIISHTDRRAIRVAKCANAACTGVSTLTTAYMSSRPDSVGYSSIAVGNDGLPVISFGEDGPEGTPGTAALKVAKCANVTCTGAATVSVVDASPNTQNDSSSIAIGTDELPVISYFDTTAQALKVAKCANETCTGVATITTVDDPTNVVGRFASIAIGTDGAPVISYHDQTAGALKVAKCANAACTGVATITTVDDPVNNVGVHTSIAIGTDGLPVISYQGQNPFALKVAKCTNAACSGTATITVVDSTFGAGHFSSIAIGSDGFPVISHGDGSVLRVAKCANAACTGAAINTVVDNVQTTGSHSSIAIGNDGLPVISYVGLGLEVAKCVTPDCR